MANCYDHRMSRRDNQAINTMQTLLNIVDFA